MEEVYVDPRPGFVVGDFKIARYDDYNYIIERGGYEPGMKKKVDKRVGKIYYYKDGGYHRYGNSYFPTVAAAATYLLNKVVPAVALEEGDVISLNELVDTINSATERIVSELSN